MKIQNIVILLTSIPVITAKFGYKKQDQYVWSQKFKSCAGKLQSPIPLRSSLAIPLPLPALEMIGYHDFLPVPITLENNGHSVAVSIKNKITNNYLPYIFGALLERDHMYEMEGLHFHWGARNNRGSEHTLNGLRFPMEMHIIHRNTLYSNLSQALEHKDGLCVLGIFFQDRDNEQLNSVIESLPNVQLLNKKTEMDLSISLASLMPDDTDVYYTYKGSLTTPPCNEAVTWIIFSSPTKISFRQLNKFRMISSGDEVLMDNYRILQSIGHRKVFVRRLNQFSKSGMNISRFNFTNIAWFWEH